MTHSHDAHPAGAEQALRGASLRVTAPRLATLEAVRHLAHADTDTVIRTVREQLPAVSHQAVYDSLAALSEAGLVRRIQPHGMVARYESRVGDNHHHLVCRECGLIIDIPCVHGAAPCMQPDDAHGFAIDEAELIFWGLCASCRAGDTAAAAS
ncbi:Fur family transcriptional regulator [Microbacterium marinilacus]|uniref:Fur family transcriptional regulator FurA1 n=1 Tax=Microbacterium marinilacus TaxID=415209 RepID=A0ABP7BD73_9MICO|nr:Fur family transcriptional regulator [Microbacterium marinilacus]MBY0690213.1 transcriptional repressor [Microbacterium marinilacus]